LKLMFARPHAAGGAVGAVWENADATKSIATKAAFIGTSGVVFQLEV
jgi:hypothetical protein